MKKVSFFWLRIFGVVLFLWLATQVNWLMILERVKELRIEYLSAYFLTFVMAFLLKVLRMQVFLDKVGVKYKFIEIYKVVVEPSFYGIVTPARIGEFSKIYYLGNLGVGKGMAWRAVLLERGVDFCLLLITSIVGVMYFFVLAKELLFIAAVLFLGLVGLLYLLLINIGQLYSTFELILKKVYPTIMAWDGVNNHFKQEGKICAETFLPYSLVILVLSFTQLWLLGHALGITANPLYLGLAYASATLVTLLPISIVGLGTREAVYIMLLGKEGITVDAAMTLSLLDGVVFSMIAAIVLMLPTLGVKHDRGN